MQNFQRHSKHKHFAAVNGIVQFVGINNRFRNCKKMYYLAVKSTLSIPSVQHMSTCIYSVSTDVIEFPTIHIDTVYVIAFRCSCMRCNTMQTFDLINYTSVRRNI